MSEKPLIISAYSASSVAALFLLLAVSALGAQEPELGTVVTGRVLDAASGEPVAAASVTVEGTNLRTLSDAEGTYRLLDVPPGPQVLRVERLGYAPARIPVTVPARGEFSRDLQIAESALELEGITVTADAGGRARGELGTATVIASEAIRNQSAASLAGVLELIPGATLQPPGLDGVQQISLRAVPVSSGGPDNLAMASAAELTAFGTLIVLDGVPMSNNANLQSLGPRGELSFATSAGGGIDLRRIPATTIERVEVIRGVPSARYGDFTQGAIIVDTRAGEVEPEVLLRYDARTGEVTLLGGQRVGESHAATVSVDVARTRISPGTRDDHAYRVAGQLSHRALLGGPGPWGDDRLVLDTRLDVFRTVQDQPEIPDLQPGFASSSRDAGLRLSHRAHLALSEETTLAFTGALDRGRQSSFRQGFRIRAAMPFTDRLTEGRSTGHYVGGQYLSELQVDGEPWQLFGRLEGAASARALGLTHAFRAGVEARREWNAGAGYQFDMEFPPQVTFNGVNGFDRPRRFDAVPPVATTAFYVDDRMTRILASDMVLNLQAGLRLDLLHDGSHWLSGPRDVVLQPRFTAELAPLPWLRVRAGAGRTAKLPQLQQFYPAPQYYDVVNVNWFANDPAERLAVLTTHVLDPTNPDLGYARADKVEAGLEVGLGAGSGISLVAFEDRISGGVGLRREPGFLLREHYQLADSTLGTGRPPQIIEPAYRADTVPVILDRPANSLTLRMRGVEMTAAFPQIRPLRTRVELQGAWIRNRLERDGPEFSRRFSEFQMDGDWARVPYWTGATSSGDRAVVTSRIIHHQPAVGLVVTGTVQHVLRDVRQDLDPADDLSFEGYLTRDGEMVPVPPERRGDSEFSDLREQRVYLISDPRKVPSDWLFSLQVSKTLPAEGRLAFYAFNALDRQGRFGQPGVPARTHPPMRFGLEVTMPAQAFLPWL